MDRLFEPEPERRGTTHGPLAARLRPRSLDEFVGQEHILGPGTALRTAFESGEVPSMVLYGPPGSGKTTLARLAAEYAGGEFEELSAVNTGKPEVRQVMARAKERQAAGRATVFFLDEIHRFNKAQQDQLLPAVEEGLVTLIGATTENPYFEINTALLSRTHLYELQPLTEGSIETLLDRALATGECKGTEVGVEIVKFLAVRAEGDARTALNALELLCSTARGRASAEGSRDGETVVATVADAEDALQRRAILYDKSGDKHYDYISAWIKSTRGSDPDASLYYLAAMIEGGEDARFIARRMVILASEDIGNADPNALSVAVAAAYAVEHVGLPECQYALAQAAIYLSLAPKSHASTQAIAAARREIREAGAKPPPNQLRSTAFPAAVKALGRGVGYQYPHTSPEHINTQEHMPEGKEGLRFYIPDEGESGFQTRLEQIRKTRGRT